MNSSFTFPVDYETDATLNENNSNAFASRVASNRVPVTSFDASDASDTLNDDLKPHPSDFESLELVSGHFSANDSSPSTSTRSALLCDYPHGHELSPSRLRRRAPRTLLSSPVTPVFHNPVETSYWSKLWSESESDILPPVALPEDPFGCSGNNDWLSGLEYKISATDSGVPVPSDSSDEQLFEEHFQGSLLFGGEVVDHSSPPPLTDASGSSRDTSPTEPLTPHVNLPRVLPEVSPNVKGALCADKEPTDEASEAPASESVSTTSPRPSDAEHLTPVPESNTPEAQLRASEPSSSTAPPSSKRKRTSKLPDRTQEKASMPPPKTIQPKQITLSVLSTTRLTPKSEITTESGAFISCRDVVGEHGSCQFEVERDGAQVKCGEELPSDDALCRRHFVLHYAERNWHHNAPLDVNCFWCGKLFQFGGLSRHIVNTHLLINSVACECTGTYSRGNQLNNRLRHERSKVHQDYLRKKAREAAAAEREVEEVRQEEDFVEGSSRGSKRRRMR